MEREEVIARLRNVADHAVYKAGAAPFIISLDDGVALYEAATILETETGRKAGRWERVRGMCTPGGDPLLRCPFCRDERSEHMGSIEMPKHWDYCPVCGADMRDGEQ